jgi:hypothetical protein
MLLRASSDSCVCCVSTSPVYDSPILWSGRAHRAVSLRGP